MPSALTSNYRIVGGIKSEVFDIPGYSARTRASKASRDTIDSVPLQTDINPKVLRGEREVKTSIIEPSGDQEGIAQAATHVAPSTSIQFLNGLDSTFSIERAYATTYSNAGEQNTSLAEVEQVKNWNDPTGTSFRRISPLEEKAVWAESSSEGLNSSGAVIVHQEVPSVSDYLTLSSSDHLQPTPALSAELSISAEETHQDTSDPRPVQLGSSLTLSTSFLSTSSVLENRFFRCAVLGESTDMLPAKIALWARSELIRPLQYQAGQLPSESTLCSEAASTHGAEVLVREPTNNTPSVDPFHPDSRNTDGGEMDIAGDQALVLYQYPCPPLNKFSYRLFNEDNENHSRSASLGSDTDEDSSWSSHSTIRIFLSSIDGELFVVNPNQLLYKVRVIDETASDFESIASPTKPDPYTATEADQSNGMECHGDDEYLFEESAMSEAYHLNVPDFDPFPDFSSFGAVHDKTIEHAHSLSQDEGYDEELQESPLDHQDTEIDSGCAHGPAKLEQDIDPETEYERPPEDSPMKSKYAEGAYGTSKFSQIAEIAEASTSAAAAAWSRELAQTMLGTECLFTFLSELKVESNGNATKEAVATAFLQLVDYERHKLGEALLPRSCSSAQILTSRILPHTTILGTTSLARFLSELVFDLKKEVSIVEIYEAFRELSKAELRAQEMATMGIMGALGQKLGKLI
ncbi:Nn.00g007790.m01.CDS01 [Neocucurbitaria sp. VM-36]